LLRGEARKTYVEVARLKSPASGDVHDPFLSVSLLGGHPSGSMTQGGKKIDGGVMLEGWNDRLGHGFEQGYYESRLCQ
jgi:hypothetical protein